MGGRTQKDPKVRVENWLPLNTDKPREKIKVEPMTPERKASIIERYSKKIDGRK